MFRLRLLLCLLVPLLACGCTVDNHDIRRGDLLKTTTLDTVTKDQPLVRFPESGVARLAGVRKVCTNYELTYARVDHQTYSHPPTSSLVIAGLALAGGGVLVGVGEGIKEEGPRGALTAIGAGLMLGSLVVTGMALFGNSESDERDVTLDEPERERETKCVESELSPVPNARWTMELGARERTGTTGADGRLALPIELHKLVVANATSDTMLMNTLNGETLQAELRMNDSPAARVNVPADRVADSTWSEWADAYAASLNAQQRLRYDACTALTSSARERLVCQKQGGAAYEKRLLPVSGSLNSVEPGYFATLNELEISEAGSFSYVVLLPQANADFFVRMVELSSGEVLAEGYSGAARAQVLSGRFPRPGRYALVHTARKSARFEGYVTLGGKPVEPSAEVSR